MSVFLSRRVCSRASCESRRALLVSLALAVALYATIFESPDEPHHRTAVLCVARHRPALHKPEVKCL